MIDILREYIKYDPYDGSFVWIKNTSACNIVGRKAGSIERKANGVSYIRISVLRKRISGGMAAWMMFYGKEPSKIIDHIDGNGLNNSISNLREADIHQNGFNRKANRGKICKLKGVSRLKCGKFTSQITINQKAEYLGIYNTEAEAHGAYKKRAKELFGDYARFQ